MTGKRNKGPFSKIRALQSPQSSPVPEVPFTCLLVHAACLSFRSHESVHPHQKDLELAFHISLRTDDNVMGCKFMFEGRHVLKILCCRLLFVEDFWIEEVYCIEKSRIRDGERSRLMSHCNTKLSQMASAEPPASIMSSSTSRTKEIMP